MKAGGRVYAIRDANGSEVNFFGFGRYVGDEVPPARDAELRDWVKCAREIDHGILACDPDKALDDQREFNRLNIDLGGQGYTAVELAGHVEAARAEATRKLGLTDDEYVDWLRTQPMFRNPRIELDNCDTVWGYQCWWGGCDGDEEVWLAEYVDGRTLNYVEVPGP